MCIHTRNLTLFFVVLNVLTHSSKNNFTEMKGPRSGSLWEYELIWDLQGGEDQWLLITLQRYVCLCLLASMQLCSTFHFCVAVCVCEHGQCAYLCIYFQNTEPTFLLLTEHMCVLVWAALYLQWLQCGWTRHWVSRHQPYPPPLFVFTLLTKQPDEITDQVCTIWCTNDSLSILVPECNEGRQVH